MLLTGPANAIAIEQFNLTPEAPEFEALFGRQAAADDYLDKLLGGHVADLSAGNAAAIADLDASADELAGAIALANELGDLEETGILEDILAEAAAADPAAESPEISLNVERVTFNINVVPFEVVEPPAAAPAPKPLPGGSGLPGAPHN